LVGKPEGKRPLISMWEDNIRIDLGEIGSKVVECIYIAQDRNQWPALVNTVLNLRVP
jgi:hypothetical protein